MHRFITLHLLICVLIINLSAQTTNKKLPVNGGEIFSCKGRTAFVIMPPADKIKTEIIPWVFYAPTLPGLPRQEGWMFEQLLEQGIAIAGIDVGESYGNLEGRKAFTDLYNELTTTKKLSTKVCLLARSRGGLMLYNWAVENPEKIACIAGIYPVSNLLSYPGMTKASKAYGYTISEFLIHLHENNPIDRLENLVKYQIPIFHIHGDIDELVPLAENSAVLKERLDALGGKMELRIIKGQGHNLWEGWFRNKELIDFIIEHTKQ